jgi:hypothetical protein
LVKPQVHAVIGAFGWQAALVGLAILPMVLVYPTALMLLKSGHTALPVRSARVLELDGFTIGEAKRQWRFGVLIVASIFGAALPGIIPHLEHAIELQGGSEAGALLTTGIMGLSLLAGRLLGGCLSDRLWAPGICAAFFVCGAAAAVGLAQPDLGRGGLIACVAAIGLTAGGEFELLAYVSARYFGLRSYGAIFGVLWGVTIGFGGVWTYLIGRLVDATGGYTVPLQICGLALCAAAALYCTLAKAPEWRPVNVVN